VDVFQYAIPKPVSVKRGQSALVPFLSAEFRGQACELYNRDVNAGHPLSVVLFKNTFGVTLDSGPITIYDEDTCIGEAMLDAIRPGDDKFLPYGVDKTVLCCVSDDTTYKPFHKCSIANGRLTKTRWVVYERTYKFDHKGSQLVAALFIEHKYRKGADYGLWDTPEPVSKTENFFRFQIKCNPGEITIFKVKERTLSHDGTDVRYASRDDVKSWFTSGYISKAANAALTGDIIPAREKMENQNRVLSSETNSLNNSVNSQSSVQNQLNGKLNGYGQQYGSSLWYTNEVNDDVISWAAQIVDFEGQIRKYRASVKVEQVKATQFQQEFESKLMKLTDDVSLE